jgi:four helix bundle protein
MKNYPFKERAMKFKTFEEMPVWQDARELTNLIYRLTEEGKFSRDFGLRDQIRRAVISVLSNIAEGYERTTKKEFAIFLGYAKGSAGELRSQLYIALDLKYITQEEFNAAYKCATEISAQLAKFSTYLRTIRAVKRGGIVVSCLLLFAI